MHQHQHHPTSPTSQRRHLAVRTQRYNCAQKEGISTSQAVSPNAVIISISHHCSALLLNDKRVPKASNPVIPTSHAKGSTLQATAPRLCLEPMCSWHQSSAMA